MSTRSSLFPPNGLRTAAGIPAVLITVALLAACSPDQRDPTGLSPRLDATRNAGSSAEALASPGWQATARNLVSLAKFNPVSAGHAYPQLGVAQYLAVQQAEAAIGGDDERGNGYHHENGDRGRRGATDRGAVAGASVVTLSYLFPTQTQSLEDMVTAQRAGAGDAKSQAAFRAGEAIGRAVGAEIVTRAIGDHFNDPNTAVAPVGPGFWFSSAVPPQPTVGGTLPGTTPWFLKSADQFRPEKPPTFGKSKFNAALAEIRAISDTRTAEQIRIATFWALNAGTPTTSGFWLSVPTDSVGSQSTVSPSVRRLTSSP